MGEVVSARVQVDNSSGRSRGFGYVEFTDAATAKKAVEEMNGVEVDGRAVKVDLATQRTANPAARAKAFNDTPSEASATLFVGNLPFSANEDQIWTLFGEYGDVVSVRLPTDRETGAPKGFGYVEFGDVDTAKKAYEGAQGSAVDGRNLRLDYSQPRSNDGGGGRGGGFGGGRGGGGGRVCSLPLFEFFF